MKHRGADLKIFAGNSNLPLAREICEYLQMPLGKAVVETFSDGETKIEIRENVRGGDVFVIQSTCAPGNNNLMELLLMLDAFKRASAQRITAVIPYYGYARQDRKVVPRVPISAKLVADLITTAGASRILTLDLHSGQIQGFFNVPVDNLYATPVLLEYLQRRLNRDEITMVSPDAGGVERARDFAARLNASLAIIDKRRVGPNVVAEMNIIGRVEGQTAVLVDDMIDTAGTLAMAAQALQRAGARRIIGCCTHAVLSGSATERVNESPIEELVVTNSVPLSARAQQCPKIKVLSVARLIGEAIRRTHFEESISSLFV
ncbi:MAG TPA: ribose-phosphate pyrophosphokinase [Candidatus Acidoferrales bacterium]|nr:ribose-phosphate pyrophosphokinase [Candidatus Acidoferrales bacterium]